MIHYKKPHELEDGDVVDMYPTLEQLWEMGVPIDTGHAASAKHNYWVVEDEMTPWQKFDGKHTDASLDSETAVIVNFGADGVWYLPPEIDIHVED